MEMLDTEPKVIPSTHIHNTHTQHTYTIHIHNTHTQHTYTYTYTTHIHNMVVKTVCERNV